jgi:ABC-2 type transport system permease protein
MLARIIALIRKELQELLRDKKSRFILVFPPLIQLLIFSFAATLDVKNVSLAVCREDSGKASIELVERFCGSTIFSDISYFKGLKEAEEALVKQKVLAILHFDSAFSRRLSSDKSSSVQMILDGRKSNTTQVILGYAQRIIDQYNEEIIQKTPSLVSPSVVIERNWFNPDLIYQWFTVPGLVAILGMITSLTASSLSVAKEKELGTFDQLLVSPLTPVEIMIGKTMPGIIVGLIEASIVLVVGVFLFKIPFTGSLLAFYIGLTIFVISIVGIGLLLSSISSTQQGAFMKVFFFISPAIMLSGFATPIANMPEWMQQVTVINPLTYFLILARGTFLKELSLIDIIPYIVPMLWIALVTLSGATFFFRKKLT